MQTYKTASGHLWTLGTDGHIYIETTEKDLRLDALDVMAMDSVLLDSKPQPKES